MHKHAQIHIRHNNKAQTTLDHNPEIIIQYVFPEKISKIVWNSKSPESTAYFSQQHAALGGNLITAI